MVQKFHSRIKEHFGNEELIVELEKLSRRYDIDNNAKTVVIYEVLRKYGIQFEKLGPGTNRLGIQIDGYVFKIALDALGHMDNRREFKYSPELYPDVIKVYECMPNGLIAVSEYVTVFDRDMYYSNTEKMRKILSRLCERYLIGDIGISANNFMNWGVRNDGSICSLDFAYIYDITSDAFLCTCKDHPYVEYDSDFNNLICPVCKKKYSFAQIRRRISDKMEEEEVGDIREKAYILKDVNQELEINPSLSQFMKNETDKDKKHKDKKSAKEPSQGELQMQELDEMSTEDRLNKIFSE